MNLLQFATQLTNDPEVARSITTEVVRKAFQMRSRFNGNPANMRAFVWTTLRHLCYDHLKLKGPDENPGPLLLDTK